MKPKMQTGVIVSHRKPDESSEAEPKEDEASESEMQEIEACIEDFMRALASKDVRKMAQIVKIAHDLLHEHMTEEPSESEAEESGNDFHSMNIKAAKENK